MSCFLWHGSIAVLHSLTGNVKCIFILKLRDVFVIIVNEIYFVFLSTSYNFEMNMIIRFQKTTGSRVGYIFLVSALVLNPLSLGIKINLFLRKIKNRN